MKTLATATVIGSLVSFAALSQDLNELDRQLTIMSGVIDTALKQDTRDAGIRYRGIDTTYLASQGAVFRIKAGHRNNFFDMRFGSFIPDAPDAPRVEVITETISELDESALEFVTLTDWEQKADEMVKNVQVFLHEAEDKLRDYRSERRETEWEIRELERRNRDLEFEMKSADKARQEEVKAELKEIQKEREALQKKEQALQAEAQKLAEAKKAELEKRAAKKAEARKAFLASFEASISDTLCSFGAGLRELPDAEHVTFVLSDFDKDDNGKSVDRVYIFNKKAIKRCVTDGLKPEQLLADAKVYSF